MELLSDFQVTIPEIGTIRAEQPPIVVITSNRTREIHDALKRRCFYYWVDYPSAARELEILKRKAPGASETPVARGRRLRAEAARDGSVQAARRRRDDRLDRGADAARQGRADPHAIDDTLGVLLKYQDDIAKIHGSEAAQLLEQVKAEVAAAARA